MIALLMLVLFAAVALAVDIGYIMLTQTELQAAADAATLGGGTELLPGLGRFATRTPLQVEQAARPVAVQFAAANGAGGLSAAYADPQRDVAFGHAVFDADAGVWQRSWGSDYAPYNMVTVTLHRDQAGSTNGDGPLPLFFAQLIGIAEQNMAVDATAVIMPVKGFTRLPDADTNPQVLPFAYREKHWRRLQAAQDWYTQHGYIPDYGNSDYPMWWDGSTSVPMFGHLEVGNKDVVVYVQDIFDNFAYDEATGGISGSITQPAPDGWLDVNIYPRDWHDLTAGNAGTIDLGDVNNPTSELERQILYGLSAEDFASMDQQGLLDESGALVLDPTMDTPATADTNGDTGLSVSIKTPLDAIRGEPRTIALFNDVWLTGNNTMFRLTEFVGVRILDVDLTGNNKAVWLQMARVVDATGVPDIDSSIGNDTTVFTPLILIE